MEYLNIMPLSIQGDGSAQTGQTGANDDNFQWHIGKLSDIQTLAPLTKYISFSQPFISFYMNVARCRSDSELWVENAEVFQSEIIGIFPKMATRASREIL